MRNPLVIAAGLVLGALIAGPIAGPAHAAAAVDPAALLPKGFKVVFVVRGDIDGDAKADYVVIGTDGPVPLSEEMSESDGVVIVDQSVGSTDVIDWTHNYRARTAGSD